MRFEKALAMMRNGEKVRLTEWNPEEYIEIDDGRFIYEDGEKYAPSACNILSEKWELFVDVHDFAWAVEQLKAGKKVRRRAYADSAFIVANGNRLQNQDGVSYILGIDDLVAKDWVLAQTARDGEGGRVMADLQRDVVEAEDATKQATRDGREWDKS